MNDKTKPAAVDADCARAGTCEIRRILIGRELFEETR